MSPRSCVRHVIFFQEFSRTETSGAVQNGGHEEVAQRIRFNESYGEQNLKSFENMDTQVLKDQIDRKLNTNHTLIKAKLPKLTDEM